jgi:hypothetical protein
MVTTGSSSDLERPLDIQIISQKQPIMPRTVSKMIYQFQKELTNKVLSNMMCVLLVNSVDRVIILKRQPGRFVKLRLAFATISPDDNTKEEDHDDDSPNGLEDD